MDGADKAAVIRAIQGLAEENGGVPVGRERFVAETGFRPSLWDGGIWLRWNDAVREAGYEPNVMQDRRLSDDDLLQRLAGLTRKLGQYPTVAHMKLERRANPDFPAKGVVTHRLGNRTEQMRRLREFVDGTPEFADVAAMLPAVADEPMPDEAADDAAQPVPGYVGEWFMLTKADVAAFKRRRSFM